MRSIRFLAAAILLPLLSACGSDGATGPTGGIVSGTWNLRSVNGMNLPYSSSPEQGTTITATASVLTISANGTYNEILSYKITSGTATTTSSATAVGTWTATGGAITFNDQTNTAVYQGSVSGNTLTEIIDGDTLVYAR